MIARMFNLPKLEAKNFFYGKFVSFDIKIKTLALTLKSQELFDGEVRAKKGVIKVKTKAIKNPLIEEELKNLISQDPTMKALVELTYESGDNWTGGESTSLFWIENSKIYLLPISKSVLNLEDIYPWTKD